MRSLPERMIVPLPLFDEAAAALRQSGSYRRDLSAQELAQIMRLIVEGLLSGQEAVRASILHTDVRIEQDQGFVSSRAEVRSPIRATVQTDCALGNDTAPGRIRLLDLNVQQEAGFLAKQALRAFDLEGRARRALSDPNQALALALRSQLEPRGATLSALGLHFNEQTLTVVLHGDPAASGS